MTDEQVKKQLTKYIENCANKKQLITVFLRTHERPFYLKIMIDSLLAQTYSNFYLIIVDNNSKDNTEEVVKSYNDDRIIYFKWDEQEPPETKMLIDNVLTKYYVQFHDDDYVDSHFLEHLLNTMEEHSEYSCLSCVVDVIDDEGNLVKAAEEYEGEYLYKEGTFLKDFYINAKRKHWICYPSTIFRMSFYNPFETFLDPKSGPARDQFLWLQTERYGGIVAISGKCLFKYRVHKNQESRTNLDMETQLFSYLMSIQYYKDFLISHMKHFSWIILNSLRKSIYDYRANILTKKGMRKRLKELPKELKKPFKNKLGFLFYRLCCVFPGLFCIIEKRYVKGIKSPY